MLDRHTDGQKLFTENSGAQITALRLILKIAANGIRNLWDPVLYGSINAFFIGKRNSKLWLILITFSFFKNNFCPNSEISFVRIQIFRKHQTIEKKIEYFFRSVLKVYYWIRKPMYVRLSFRFVKFYKFNIFLFI